jgi:curved DNA-binding protein CbpA
VQIPLDYYRILGLPVAASHEQLQQAYRDRLIQLPRREYSQAAIAARKQLIEQAYAVLSDSEQRRIYDTNYFAHRYEQQSVPDDTQPRSEFPVEDIFAPHTPTIDVADHLFVGALLILQELGEYELVLTLGNSHLNTSNRKLNFVQFHNDIVLTIALAYLELGREQWQQRQYEKAANSLQDGAQLLSREGILLSIRDDILADLNKLRPYRILALLKEPEGTSLERRYLGLKLLQDLLDARGGIDGTSNDGSGLSLDDFLRFIQQIRSYLTVSEQQSLFEAESKRPSAVANYLAVYALIARGFTQRMPVLISQAKQLLLHLAQVKPQDVYLEQAIATLLLGQTVEANQALELLQEYEPLEFIREHSQGSPDLLPGLCLYAERWLQTEVFPQFCDLKHQPASLKEYFADQHVQAYLEALPTQIEATQQKAAAMTATSARVNQNQQQVRPARMQHTTDVAVEDVTKLTTVIHPTANNGALVPTTKRPNSVSGNSNQTTSALEHVRVSPRTRRRRKQISTKRKTALAVIALTGLLASVFLFALLGQAFGWLRRTLYPAPPLLPGEQLSVELNQPLIAIPTPGSQFSPVAEPLDAATAEQVVQSWLSAKSSAFSTNYAVESLQNILVDPALAQWQQRVRNDRANNRYRQFQHSVKIDSVQVNPTNPDLATVQAIVSEVARVYENGQLNQRASYADQALRVRYDVVRRNSAWQIRQMQVLN